MTLQDIRRYFETPVVNVCASFDIPYRPANTLEPNGDAYSEFVESRLQFGEMSEPVVSDCSILSNIRGAFIVEYYGPKGRGPARAQNYMEVLYCQMNLPGVTGMNGPSFTELSDRPYYFARLSMAIINNSYITTLADERYVNRDGDSMTGSLIIERPADLLLKSASSSENVIAEIGTDGSVIGTNTLDGGTY